MPHRLARLLRYIVGILVIPMGLLLTSGVASATTAIDLRPRATMMFRGIFVSVPVSITCDIEFAYTTFVFVEVEQITAKGTVSGVGEFRERLICDGAAHQVKVVVIGEIGGRLFRPGSALARASTEVCARHSCEYASTGDWRTIRVTRP